MTKVGDSAGWTGLEAEGVKPPIAWWLWPLWIVWGTVSAWIAWVWGATATLDERRDAYCGRAGDSESLGFPCWPTYAEDPGANLERWAWTVVIFLVFSAPLWLPAVVRWRQRRRSP